MFLCEQGQRWSARTRTMYMYVRQSENVYYKVQITSCKIKSSKLSSLIDSFRPFINHTCSMELLVKSNNLRIFTNFKIWVKFVNFYKF